MKKILIIDDDPDILSLVSFNLEKAGYKTVTASDGVQGLELTRKQTPDLVVLDVMLPEFSGLEVLKTLKFDSALKRIPVVLLTARGEELDRVLGLELGADDYVPKPFSVRELLLRIRRILERVEDQRQGDVILRCDGIALDEERYDVRIDGEPLQLTTTEFNLLSYMLRNQGRVLSRDRLLETVWGYSYGGATRTVDTHIQRLREKLGRHGRCIETVRGFGYKLESKGPDASDGTGT